MYVKCSENEVDGVSEPSFMLTCNKSQGTCGRSFRMSPFLVLRLPLSITDLQALIVVRIKQIEQTSNNKQTLSMLS
jgi:hypothetical protein